jgi:hypothetical protein
VAQWETAIGVICILTGLLAFGSDRNWRTFSLCILLIWQGSLYLAAPLSSLFSLNREAALGTPVRVTEQGKPMLEQLAARWVMAFSMVLIGSFSLIRFLPSPTELPGYARFLPVELSPEDSIGRQPEATTTAPTGTTLATPTATIPSTVSGIATVKVESANCRSRPRGGAERVTIFYSGQQLEIVGRNADVKNPWWYVKIPGLSGNCWLWSMTATMTGNIDEIPIIQ